MLGGRNLRSATLAVLGALALVAIGITLESRGDPAFQADVARALAGRSDAVATSLARGNRCAANRDADRLRTESAVAVRRDLVSARIGAELLMRTRRLAQSITCPPPAAARPASQSPPAAPTPKPAPRTPPTHTAPPPRAGHRGKGKDERGDRGRGKKRGHRGDGDSE